LLAGLAALFLPTAAAQQPGRRYLLTFENNQPRIQLVQGEQQAADSSLDRLKERSAQDRFDRLRQQQASSTAREPLPLLEPSEAAPVPLAPPAPGENRLPRLPEVQELERNDPFVKSQQALPGVTTMPAVPPTPAENQLPRLPDVDELERNVPFVRSQQKLQSGTSSRALTPVPAGNQSPRLPSLDDMKEFDPFREARQQLQAVQPQPRAQQIVRPVPAPAPAPMPALPVPVNSAFQEPESGREMLPGTPDVVRSLSGIQPNYDYQFQVKEDYLGQTTVADSTQVPKEADFPHVVYGERLSPESLFAWEASNLYHNPLYFEDPALERYGHVHPVIQPFVSLTRIGVQTLGLPYQSVIDTPCTKRYVLGWFRPGEEAPHLCYQIPLNPEAAAAEAAAVTTGFLIVP